MRSEKMNKKTINAFISLAVGAVAVFSCVAAACTDGDNGQISLTYDYNYEGAPESRVEKINEGDVAVRPEDPVRENYSFIDWFNQPENGTKFDFEDAIYEDVTIYAQWKQTAANIIFDYNYTGAPAATNMTVAIDAKISQPANPERSGYIFTSWYEDSECKNVYDFTASVTGDKTLYAGWEADTGDNVVLTYMWNYDGAPNGGTANVSKIKKNSKTTAYAAERENYYLAGWFTDSECTEKFNFDKRIDKSATLYAKWFDIYTFEAEYVDYTGMIGNGYSGNQSGVGLIVKEKSESQQASNGHYAGWMYKEGNTLTFDITSDKDVTDAVLVLRLSAEFYNMTLTSDKYLVQVNGDNLEYKDIEITGVPEQGSQQWRTFTDYKISASVKLNKGKNTIKLIVNNADRLGESGTMYATAPLTDCMYIYTDAELTWEPLVGNLLGNIS